MKVVIDGVAFENPHQRGVQRYFCELIGRFPADVRGTLLLTDAPRAPLPSGADVARVLPAPVRLLPRKWRRSLNAPLSRPSRVRHERDADVFHSSYFTLPIANVPTVVTVHDMAVERFIEFFGTPWAEREVHRKRSAIQTADLLIAVSHATARELEAFYPETAGRIVVIHHGADHIPEASPTAPGAPRDPFALIVGDRGGYKNFRRILEALEEPAWPKGISLHIAGPPPTPSEQMLSNRMSRGGVSVQFLGRVDDTDLARLYGRAAVTIIPSLVEGFGFPVVEAQRAGCPVACSDIEVFREIGRESVAYFDPLCAGSLAEAIARTVGASESHRLTEAGLINARSFTWAKCVEQTIAAYSRAIELRRISRGAPQARA